MKLFKPEKTMKTILAILVGILFTLCGRVSAQPAGTLDSTFNGNGKVVYDKDVTDIYQDVKVQPDGKIIAAGSSMGAGYVPYVVVSRYMTDGSLDPSFGINGNYVMTYLSEAGVYKCLIRDNGKILLCGYATDYNVYGVLLIQLNTDGTVDLSFGNNGIEFQATGLTGGFASNFYALTLQADGKILVAGYLTDSTYNQIPVVLRFSETGVLDPTFGSAGIAQIPVTQLDNDFSAVSVQSDGKIVAAGHIQSGLSWFTLLIARFDPDGNLDTTYGTSGIVNLNLNNVDDEFFSLTLTADDQAILAGFTVSQADFYYHLLVMKFDGSGQPVTGFGSNGQVVYGAVPYTVGDALIMQPDGKILISGSTGELQPANNDFALWRFNADGSPDNTFGTNGIVTTDFFGNADEALGIALYADKIVLAGRTRNATQHQDFAVARYINDYNVSVNEKAPFLTFSLSPNPVKHNATVRLIYGLKNSESISIELLSSTGSSIKEIQLGKQSAGEHTWLFKIPSDIPSGMIYFRMKGSESGTGTAKVVVAD
jgi:uncharacterized delta-60 repeat protein